MAHRIFTLFFWLSAAYACHAQILPLDGMILNYNQVMFEYEKVKGAQTYLVQVAEDTADTSFDHPFIVQSDSAPATMISGLDFGKKYKWRYAGMVRGKESVWHGHYHFSIEVDTMVRLGLVDLSVTMNESGNAGGLIVNDATHTIIDRRGRLVWYLPKIDWQFIRARRTSLEKNKNLPPKIEVKPYIFDLRLTPYGTVTYLTDSDLIECDLSGGILWQKHDCVSPAEMGEEDYNHVFMHLPNGNYMALGNEMWRKMPDYCDNISHAKYHIKKIYYRTEYAKVEFGTVIEYNKKGDVVWSWNSENYFDRYGFADGLANTEMKAHINALSIDRNNEFVYVGFRDISRIIKIEKSTGDVVDSWGPRSPIGVGPVHQLYLHKQHDGTILDDGTVMTFDNNDYLNGDSVPSVLIFSQQPADDGQIVWRYDYDLSSDARRLSRTGGNADMLPNGNILICTGTVNQIAEVTKDKRMVWQAEIIPRATPGIEYTYRLYRAHYVSSLYPCYFTFLTDRDTIKKKSQEFSTRIFNKGSENDGYIVKISSAPGIVLSQFSIQNINPNHSLTFKTKLGQELSKGQEIEISITSKTNPDLERKRWVVVN